MKRKFPAKRRVVKVAFLATTCIGLYVWMLHRMDQLGHPGSWGGPFGHL